MPVCPSLSHIVVATTRHQCDSLTFSVRPLLRPEFGRTLFSRNGRSAVWRQPFKSCLCAPNPHIGVATHKSRPKHVPCVGRYGHRSNHGPLPPRGCGCNPLSSVPLLDCWYSPPHRSVAAFPLPQCCVLSTTITLPLPLPLPLPFMPMCPSLSHIVVVSTRHQCDSLTPYQVRSRPLIRPVWEELSGQHVVL